MTAVDNDSLQTGVHGGFGVVALTFLHETLYQTIPWLIAMMCVVVCDLCVALRRCYLMGERVRLSRAVRATMGKMVTYSSFVLMVCVVEVAVGRDMHIDRWACLAVCVIEFSSIVSNLLRPKGVEVDFVRLAAALCSRLFRLDTKAVEGIIRKTKKEE